MQKSFKVRLTVDNTDQKDIGMKGQRQGHRGHYGSTTIKLLFCCNLHE